jgi:hypothetical protein
MTQKEPKNQTQAQNPSPTAPSPTEIALSVQKAMLVAGADHANAKDLAETVYDRANWAIKVSQRAASAILLVALLLQPVFAQPTTNCSLSGRSPDPGCGRT